MEGWRCYERFRINTVLVVTFLAFGLAACGGSSDSPSTAPTGRAEILIQPAGDQMLFEQTTFTVAAGQEVLLTLENTATSAAMQHNVVILNTSDEAEVSRIGIASFTAGAEANYVPDDPAVLAATAVSQPGETVTVTFTAPTQPGTYVYICTFPGHYTMMKGTMIVS